MKVVIQGMLTLAASLLLVSCSMSNSSQSAGNSGIANPQANVTTLAAGAPLEGDLGTKMDANDNEKVSKALDAALGKPTSWKNPISDIAFVVTPIQKIRTSDNKICRTYSLKADRNGQIDEVRGTACVSDKGAWQVMG
jgi:surface antigen